MCIQQLQQHYHLWQTQGMIFVFIVATGIKIFFLVFADYNFIRLPVQLYRSLYCFIFRMFNSCLIGSQESFCIYQCFRRAQKPQRFQINHLHFRYCMALVIFYILGLQVAPVNHFLQLKQCGSFMTADISQVIRAATTQRSSFGVFKFLYVNFVISRVAVILYPEHS